MTLFHQGHGECHEFVDLPLEFQLHQRDASIFLSVPCDADKVAHAFERDQKIVQIAVMHLG